VAFRAAVGFSVQGKAKKIPSGASEGLALTLAFSQGAQAVRGAATDVAGESSASRPDATASRYLDGNVSRPVIIRRVVAVFRLKTADQPPGGRQNGLKKIYIKALLPPLSRNTSHHPPMTNVAGSGQ
jgi:hypothetical protein